MQNPCRRLVGSRRQPWLAGVAAAAMVLMLGAGSARAQLFVNDNEIVNFSTYNNPVLLKGTPYITPRAPIT